MKKFIAIMLLFMLAGITGCKEQPQDLERINDQIDAFIETYASTYVNVTSQDFYVARALGLLEQYGYDVKLSDYLTKTDMQSLYESKEYSGLGDIFKALIIADLYEEEPASAKTALEAISSVETWNHVYGFIALEKTGVNSTLKQEVLSQMLVRTENDFRDADFAGMALMATAHLDINRSLFLGLIEEAVTEDGIASSWSGANASSTAMAILGYLAIDEDPRTILSIDLVSVLLEYFVEGAAKNTLTDTEVDLLFATPQAFSALVAYKIAVEKNVVVNLFA